jgi:hypothetical protein
MVSPIRDIPSYSYVKWDQGKASAIDEKALKNFEYRKRKYNIGQGNGRLFYRSFRAWQNGKASPICDKVYNRFKLAQFSLSALKQYGIGKNNKRYTIHHPIPKQYFPDKAFDLNNTMPVSKLIHQTVHKEYSNQELLVDPIMPVIESLEASSMEAK